MRWLERGCPGVGGLLSTLLGPEATGRLVGVFLDVRVAGWRSYRREGLFSSGWCSLVAWWVRPLLENCIVDASIFEFYQDDLVTCRVPFVVSWLWLLVFLGFCDCSVVEVFKGTLVDALALGAEEGRCSLR